MIMLLNAAILALLRVVVVGSCGGAEGRVSRSGCDGECSVVMGGWEGGRRALMGGGKVRWARPAGRLARPCINNVRAGQCWADMRAFYGGEMS
jgi:hypothetical protein